MKLWAIAMVALRANDGVIMNSVCAGGVLKQTEGDAIGEGYIMAMKRWPPSEGWSNHGVAVCEVPVDTFERMLEHLRAEQVGLSIGDYDNINEAVDMLKNAND